MYCEKCGTKLENGAKFCTGCGAAIGVPVQQPPTQNPKVSAAATRRNKVFENFMVLVIAVFLIFGGFFAFVDFITEGDSDAETTETTVDTSEGSETNPYVLNADEWYSEFCSGESQVKYLDQWVKVTGTVLTSLDYKDLTGYYLAGGGMTGLVCWVPKNDAVVQYGQIIEYIGKVTAEGMKHIEVTEGKIVSAQWPSEKPISPITISELSWSKDYVGGIEWNFKFTNNTDKVIKYITMEWNCYNAVGDKIYDEITGDSNHSVKYTGPLDPGQTTDLLRNTSLFYNHSYNSLKFTKLQVEFMDGTVIRITDQGYSNIIASE